MDCGIFYFREANPRWLCKRDWDFFLLLSRRVQIVLYNTALFDLYDSAAAKSRVKVEEFLEKSRTLCHLTKSKITQRKQQKQKQQRKILFIMNFNLKHLVLSIVAVIFIMGSAAVADVTQLRGVGEDAHNSRALQTGCPRGPPRSLNGNKCLRFLRRNQNQKTCSYRPNGGRVDCRCTRNSPFWSCARQARVLDENAPLRPPTRRVLDENEGAVSAESVDANGAIVNSSGPNACPPRPPPRFDGNRCSSYLQPNSSGTTCTYGNWYQNGEGLRCACTRNSPFWSCGRA